MSKQKVFSEEDLRAIKKNQQLSLSSKKINQEKKGKPQKNIQKGTQMHKKLKKYISILFDAFIFVSFSLFFFLLGVIYEKYFPGSLDHFLGV